MNIPQTSVSTQSRYVNSGIDADKHAIVRLYLRSMESTGQVRVSVSNPAGSTTGAIRHSAHSGYTHFVVIRVENHCSWEIS